MLEAGCSSFLRETYRHLITTGELLLVKFYTRMHTHTHTHGHTQRMEGKLMSERESMTVSLVKTGIVV